MLNKDLVDDLVCTLCQQYGEEDVARLLQVYDEVFPIMCDAVDNDSMAQYLHCKPNEPLLKVRQVNVTLDARHECSSR